MLVFMVVLGAFLMALLVGGPILYSLVIRRKARNSAWITLDQRMYGVSNSIRMAGTCMAFAPAALCLGIGLWHYIALPSFPVIEAPLFVIFAVIGYRASRSLGKFRLAVQNDRLLIYRPGRVEQVALNDLVAADCRKGRLVLMLRSGQFHSVPAIFDATDRILAGLLTRAVENGRHKVML